jgi:hippurate hydrolase
VDFRTIFHPVLNNAAASIVAADVCDELVGEANVFREGQPGTGSEDFSFMSEHVPSCYLSLGNGAESHPLHNQDYDFNDNGLVYGASFFARVVEKTLVAEK